MHFDSHINKMSCQKGQVCAYVCVFVAMLLILNRVRLLFDSVRNISPGNFSFTTPFVCYVSEIQFIYFIVLVNRHFDMAFDLENYPSFFQHVFFSVMYRLRNLIQRELFQGFSIGLLHFHSEVGRKIVTSTSGKHWYCYVFCCSCPTLMEKHGAARTIKNRVGVDCRTG